MAFISEFGHFQWRVAPFGLTSLPAYFSRLMSSVLQKFIGRFVAVYLDDILIYLRNAKEHEGHLRQVFAELRRHELFLHPGKTELFLRWVTYLGFRIENGEVSIDDGKVEAVRKLALPQSVKGLRSVMGLLAYFRRFVKNFSTMAAPLTELLKDGKQFEITHAVRAAFENLKSTICSAPVLRLPDLEHLQFEVTTDASEIGMGGMLTQNGHPVAFESRKLTYAERRYAVHERKIYAVVYCMFKWRHFLEGAHTKVFTDNAVLTYMTSKVPPSRRMTRFLEKLSRFDYEIKHLPGKSNVVADALSRLERVNLLTSTQLTSYAREGKQTGLSAPEKALLRKEMAGVVHDETTGIYTREVDGRPRIWVEPENRTDVLADAHQALGHLSARALYEHLRTRVWWRTLRADVYTAVQHCPRCQLNQVQARLVRRAPLHPLPTETIFTRWHLDFIGKLPKAFGSGNQWILVAVESLTRWSVVRAMPEATHENVAKFIYEDIVSQYGAPVQILTDRGANFRSKVVEEYLRLLPTSQKFTSSYHPRTNSTVERWNRTFQEVLVKLTGGAVTRWDRFINQANMALRMRTSRVTGMSPFEILYGVKPRVPGLTQAPMLFDPVDMDVSVQERVKELEQLGRTREAVKVATEAAKKQMARNYNWRVSADPLKPGDYVLLINETKTKGQYRHFGPFRVLEQRLFDTYRLTEPDGTPLKTLVHRDRMKRAHVKEKPKNYWYHPTRDELNGLRGE